MQPPLMDFKNGKWLTGSLTPLAKKLASKEITPEEYAAKYALAMSTIPTRRPTGAANPLTLKDFGYFYNEKGELRTIKDPESGFIWLGQKHYDYLGEVIVEHIYSVLESPEFNLQRRMVPLKNTDTATVEGTKSRSLSPKRPREEDDNDGATTATTTAMEATSNEKSDVVVPAPPSPTAVPPPMAEKVEKEEDDVSIPIFASANLDSYETVMLLSQGSGAVRPGMWARALCVNNSLEAGSIFTYLREAKARNWGIIVTNPNENTGFSGVRSVHSNLTLWGDSTNQVMDSKIANATQAAGGVPLSEAYWLGTPDPDWKKYSNFVMRKFATPVPHSDTPPAHTVHVYNNLILPSPAKQVFIVAHSYGGVCSGGLLRDPASFPDLQKRCPAIAFTDAINTINKRDDKAVRKFNKERVINWVASPHPLDTPCGADPDGGNEERSAGHTAHEWTSASCCSSVFKFFDDSAARSASN